MTVTYSNQKFFLKIEGGEQIEIINICILQISIFDLSLLKHGDSFPLPSGIGYRIEWLCGKCGAHRSVDSILCYNAYCQRRREATLYVIEEEKEPEQCSNEGLGLIVKASNVILILNEYIHGLAAGRTEEGIEMAFKNASEAFERLSNSQPTTQGKQR